MYLKQSLIILILFLMIGVSCKPGKVNTLKTQLAAKEDKIQMLEQQLDHAQVTTKSLLDRMADLSVISKSESRSIQSSLENLNRQNVLIEELQSEIKEKDSINFALVTNIRRSLLDVNDEDIIVEVKGSAVYVSIADKLLFRTGSYHISDRAHEILGKVARVIHDHYELNVMVEGHTDNVPISNTRIQDNWDLSVLRATSVVRILQEEYDVEPERLTASGKANFDPKAENSTMTGRSQNRRTEIIFIPKLDQFFKLLESPELLG